MRKTLERQHADLLRVLHDPHETSARKDELLRDLVERYRGGDGRALGPLTAAFWSALQGAAAHLGGPDAWGDALEALTDVLDHLDLAACQSVAGAITTRLRFAPIDRARARGTEQQALTALAEGVAVGADLGELLCDDDDSAQGAGMSLGLSEEDRRLLVAVHVEGRTMAEVAGELGITRTAAKVRHHRLLARLRKVAK